MKKLYVSADIEGTCGIVHWDETTRNHPDYPYFAQQMTREVAAACAGAFEAGFASALVKDAHDSARNINPLALPANAQVLRGWGGHPYCMMMGLDGSFAGVVFTGYHNAAGTGSNPLSHTMTTRVLEVRINGELVSELHLNALIAARERVPVLAVTGDDGVCGWAAERLPGAETVPVNWGTGGAARSTHPDRAVESIREAVARAARQPMQGRTLPMPEHFHVEMTFRDHAQAYRLSFYPGIRQASVRTLVYEADDYFDVLRMAHFVL